MHALRLFQSELEESLENASTPAERLADIARAYVRFAAEHEAFFQALLKLRLDKSRHLEVVVAEQPIEDAFRATVRAVLPHRDHVAEEALAAAVEAVAHGHATLLLDGRFGKGRRALKRATESASRATGALIDGWR